MITLSKISEIFVDYLFYHAITLIIVGSIILTIYLHHHGSSKNLALAKQTTSEINQLLTKSFNHYSSELVVESPNVLKLYASGRDSCLFAIFAFALVPRQQILSFLLNSVLFKLKDEVVIEIPILNKMPLPLSLAIIRKKNVKLLTKKSYPDIKNLCKEYRPIADSLYNVPNTHSILVEKLEHVRYLLESEKEANTWKNHGKSVKMLYLSDVNKFSRYAMAVRMVINLGPDVLPLVQWLLAFVDRMAKMRMSIGERKQANKKREDLNINYDA